MSPKKLKKRLSQKLVVGVAAPHPPALVRVKPRYIKVITISERVSFDDGQWCSKAADAAAVVHNT